MGIDVLSKATGRRLVHWTPANVRDCVLWQGPAAGRVTYNTQPSNANSDFAAWSGVYPNQAPDNWQVFSAGTVANHMEPSGNACRIISDYTAGVWLYKTCVVGNRYKATLDVSSITGQIRDPSDNAAPVITAGSHVRDYTATEPISVGWKRSAVCDAVFTNALFTNISLTSLAPVIGAPLTQATATVMPWVDVSTKQVRYNGGDALVSSSSTSAFKFMHDGTGGTMIVCFKPFTVGSTVYFATTALPVSSTNVGIGLFIQNVGNVGVTVMNGTGTYDLVYVASQTISINMTYVMTVRVARGDNNVKVRVNSVNKSSASLTSPSAANPTTGFSVGAQQSGVGIDGLIPDYAVYNRVLTDSECLRIERYMYRQAEGVDPSW